MFDTPQILRYSLLAHLLLGLNVLANENEEKIAQNLAALSLEELLEVTVVDVSVASGFKQKNTQAPAVTSLITAQDIQASGANDLGEVLSWVPGLFVSPNKSLDHNYKIRGVESFTQNETLLLINGQPYKNLLSGDRGDWSGLPLENIKRIEVIRGPGSALYGADAFAGVINIITKTAVDIAGTQMGARFASQKNQDVWLLHGSQHQGVDVALNLHYHTADSEYSVYQLSAQPNEIPIVEKIPGIQTDLQRMNGSLDLSKDHWRLRMGYMGLRRSYNPDPLEALDDQSADENRAHAELSYHNPELRPNWELQSHLSYVYWQDKARYFEEIDLLESLAGLSLNPQDYQPLANYRIDTTEAQIRFSTHFIYSGFKHHKLLFGLGYTQEDLLRTKIEVGLSTLANEQQILDVGAATRRNNPNPDRDAWHSFIQDTWSITEDWKLTAGLRYDHYSDFDSTLNPRLALVWQANTQFSSKLLYGKAFIAPAYMLLNLQNDSFVQVNPDLQPQTIDTYELAFDYHPSSTWNLSLNLYYYKIKDKFSLSLNPQSTGLMLFNTAKQTGRGGELEANWRVSENSKLSAHYAYNNINAEGTSSYPRHQVHLRHHWAFNTSWHVSTQLNWIKYQKTDNPLALPLPLDNTFSRLDFTLHYQLPQQTRWSFIMGVRNALDGDAENLTASSAQAERSYFAELRYRLD